MVQKVSISSLFHVRLIQMIQLSPIQQSSSQHSSLVLLELKEKIKIGLLLGERILMTQLMPLQVVMLSTQSTSQLLVDQLLQDTLSSLLMLTKIGIDSPKTQDFQLLGILVHLLQEELQSQSTSLKRAQALVHVL